MHDKYFPLTLRTLVKMLGGRLQQLSKLPWIFQAPKYYDLSKQLLNSYKRLGCNISLKVYFLHSHANYFPENLDAMIEEEGESFHQDIKTTEKIPGMLEYQHVGRLCLVLRKRLLAVATPEKH